MAGETARVNGNADEPEIRILTTAEVLPLRHAVLRSGRPLETARFANDEAPGTRHLGAYRDGKLLAVASLYIEEMPNRPGVSATQIRGVATSPEARGTGLGVALMNVAREYAREKGAQILWCNARGSAAAFYRKLGYSIVGDEFEIPDVGPHFRMMLELGPTN